MNDIVSQLVELQARRKFYIRVCTANVNQARAMVRLGLGFRADEAEDGRAKLVARASKIVNAVFADKPCDDALAYKFEDDLKLVAAALLPFESVRSDVERNMKKAVRALPGYAFVKGVRGFGDLAFAVIVAEAGDLAGYSEVGKLWKRLGLCPFDGHAGRTWKTGQGGRALTKEEWVAFGYNGKRLSQVYSCLTEPLFKQQSMVSGPYRAIYDARRIRTAQTHPDWSKLHSHNDALRIMAQCAIRDLWVEWRRSSESLIDSIEPVNAATHADQEQQRAHVSLGI